MNDSFTFGFFAAISNSYYATPEGCDSHEYALGYCAGFRVFDRLSELEA